MNEPKAVTYEDVLESWHPTEVVTSWRWGTRRLYVQDEKPMETLGCIVSFSTEEGVTDRVSAPADVYPVRKVMRPTWEPAK